MMTLLRATALCGTLLAALPAAAQQFAGGQVDLTMRSFDDLGIETTSARVSGEMALSRSFSLQGDLFTGTDDSLGDDDSSFGATLHGLLHVSETSTVGVFTTYEGNDSSSFGSFGVEAGASFGEIATEIWLGVGENDTGSDANYFGLETRRAFGLVHLFGGVEYYNISGEIESVQSGLGVEYQSAGGFGLTAKIEDNYFEYDDQFSFDDTSVSIGASYRFGKRPGTVFGERSLSGIFR